MVRWHKTMWALAALTITACNSTPKDQTSQIITQINNAEITIVHNTSELIRRRANILAFEGGAGPGAGAVSMSRARFPQTGDGGD